MHELERIEHALKTADLDPVLFERCAQDLLSEIYPGLSPVPGGTDWGRDADIHNGDIEVATRLMVTKSRDYSGIRSNMLDGLNSLAQHGVPFDRIVLANPGNLNEIQRNNLRKEAATRHARLESIYDMGFFASKLRRDGEWRQRVLGLSGVPITVSRVPWQLAESLWRQIPLVGRGELVEQLTIGSADAILLGRPGVGKTRLLAEIPDALFVDVDAPEERLADDIRWLRPSVLIIDDVGQRLPIVEFLQRLRRQDADLLNFRCVVVCWPDEIERVRTILPGATEVSVDLLERVQIDEIIRATGVTGVLARQEILDQAEGRPGWAIALADLLLRSGWEQLVTGKALLGQVDGYLRRTQMTQAAQDVLAIVATLRGVSEKDLAKLAEMVGVSRSEVGRLLRRVAEGGLIDIEETSSASGLERRYTVRPPMLAEAIAAEHFFFGDVPLGDVEQLTDAWPDKQVEVAHMRCHAARLGSEVARIGLDQKVDGILAGGLRPEVVRNLLEVYLLVDREAASRVVQKLKIEFEGLSEEARADGYRMLPLVELSYLAAARYFDRDAIRLLLDLAVYDQRPTNPHPEHPVRKLADLCTRIHPDIRPSADHRVLIATVLDEWMPAAPTLNIWRTWITIAESVLTPRVRGSYTAPEDAHRFNLIESVVSPEHAALIAQELWPTVLNRLRGAPSAIVAEAVGVAQEWLRVGGGHDRPFGNSHSEQSIAAAATVAQKMFADLVTLAPKGMGLKAKLAATASMFGLSISEELIATIEEDPFFRDVELTTDWESSSRQLRAEIAELVENWAFESPVEVIERLRLLRDEMQISGSLGLDRVSIACDVIANLAADAEAWVNAALSASLFPEANPFVEKLVTSMQIGELDTFRKCLADPAARSRAIASALARSSDNEVIELSISHLGAGDFGMLDMLMSRSELSVEIQRQILRTAPTIARGVFAIAVAGRMNNIKDAIPANLRDDFIDAFLEILPSAFVQYATHSFVRLMQQMSSYAPDVLEELIRRRIREAPRGGLSHCLGHEVWNSIHMLPAQNKTALLGNFAEAETRLFLLVHLARRDCDWLEELLNNGIINPEEALTAASFYGEASIDRVASLLVPRGVEPERIASLAFSGSWIGAQSARYQELVVQFQGFAESKDPNVAAVGGAGVEIFGRARDGALERERQKRIRGEP